MGARALPRGLYPVPEEPQVAVQAIAAAHARTCAKCRPEGLQLSAISYSSAWLIFKSFAELVLCHGTFVAAFDRGAVLDPGSPAAALGGSDGDSGKKGDARLLENNPAIQHITPRVRLFSTGHWLGGRGGVRATGTAGQRGHARRHALPMLMELDYRGVSIRRLRSLLRSGEVI